MHKKGECIFKGAKFSFCTRNMEVTGTFAIIYPSTKVAGELNYSFLASYLVVFTYYKFVWINVF